MSPAYRRRRVTSGSAALGVALFVLLLATVFALGAVVYRTTATSETSALDPLAGRPGSTATTVVQGGAQPDTTDTTQPRGRLIRPQAASASSALKPTPTQDFRAPNLLDDDLATAWMEGVEGPGIGECVRFDFIDPVSLTRIELLNGYQIDDERFQGAIRVKQLRLEYSYGSTQIVDLYDSKEPQSITARSRPTEWLKLTVLSVYPDYIWEDAALSEVRLFESATQ